MISVASHDHVPWHTDRRNEKRPSDIIKRLRKGWHQPRLDVLSLLCLGPDGSHCSNRGEHGPGVAVGFYCKAESEFSIVRVFCVRVCVLCVRVCVCVGGDASWRPYYMSVRHRDILCRTNH